MAATGPSSPQTTKESSSTSATAKGAGATGATEAREAREVKASPQCRTNEPSSTTPTTTPSTTPTMPTYHQTKNSKAYLLAKSSLQKGNLDEALSTLESALRDTMAALEAFSKSRASEEKETKDGEKGDNDDKDGEEDLEEEELGELHESLAPLYYLYGTTLLYSVEESEDMMAKGAGGAGGGQDQEVDGGDGGEGGDGADGGDGEEEDQAPPSDDIEIAWENLETARNILTRLISEEDIQSVLRASGGEVEEDSTVIVLNSSNADTNNGNKTNNGNDDKSSAKSTQSTKYTPTQLKELVLDLAHIHTRLGDLQRANAKYLDAIPDYQRALELRGCLGRFERQVADAHFSLATAYVEAPKGMDGEDGMGSGGEERLTEEEAIQFRAKSMDHYLACGVAFAGLIAKLCGEDAEKFTTVDAADLQSFADVADGAADDADGNEGTGDADNTPRSIHSQTLHTLRHRIANLTPPTSLSPSDKDKFHDLKELMDELQEAMDASENTEQALKDVAVMKANEIKKHAGGAHGEQGVGGEGCAGGATTTIGFGSTAGTEAVTTLGAGTTGTSSTTAVAAAPMMVVKKKKKKVDLQVDGEAKRAKTE